SHRSAQRRSARGSDRGAAPAAEHAVPAGIAADGGAPLERAGHPEGARGAGADRPRGQAGGRCVSGADERRRRGLRRNDCGGAYFAAASDLTLRVSRLLYREAALSWITPFFAALSIWPTVSSSSDCAVLALPSAIAAR